MEWKKTLLSRPKRALLTQTQQIATGAMIGALYATITVALAPLSYGWVQFRVAEAFTITPVAFGYWGAIGLFIGCIVANFFGGFGAIDIVGGSLCTLAAGVLTANRRTSPNILIAGIWPVVINAFGVSAYLYFFFAVPYWLIVISIFTSQALIVYLIGVPVLYAVHQRFPHYFEHQDEG